MLKRHRLPEPLPDFDLGPGATWLLFFRLPDGVPMPTNQAQDSASALRRHLAHRYRTNTYSVQVAYNAARMPVGLQVDQLT